MTLADELLDIAIECEGNAEDIGWDPTGAPTLTRHFLNLSELYFVAAWLAERHPDLPCSDPRNPSLVGTLVQAGACREDRRP